MAGHVFGELNAYHDELVAGYPEASKVLFFLSMAFLRHGHIAVAIFIVISGYCLMLPLAMKDSMQTESFWRFVLRRARRILPPYYAAVGISLLLMAVVPRMNAVSQGSWYRPAVPGFEPRALVSHLFRFHHWTDQWIGKIDPPLWSIGVEWLIFFLMPLIFLPLLRRLGRVWMRVATALLGVVLTYLAVERHFIQILPAHAR